MPVTFDLKTINAYNRRVFQRISFKIGIDPHTVEYYKCVEQGQPKVKDTVTFDLIMINACNGCVFQPISLRLAMYLRTIDFHRC